MSKKWLINVSEEPNMINATLDNGRSLKPIFIRCHLFLLFQAIRKSKKYVKFNKYQIKVSFMLVPVSRMANLASVELSG